MMRPLFILIVLIALAPAVAQAQENAKPISKEIEQGFLSLKGADATVRQAFFDLISKKGDARLVPALAAYKDGKLLLRDGRLCTFGERVEVPGKGSMLPLIDALTGEPILGADNQPMLFAKVDLTGAIKAPPPAEKRVVNDLIAGLSLNHPIAARRKEAIHIAGDRADDALLKPLQAQLDADPDGPFSGPLRESIARIQLAKGDRDTKLAAAQVLGDVQSSRALASLGKAKAAPENKDDAELLAAIDRSITTAEKYQSQVRAIHHSFAGLSLGSILVLLALGLSIIFGLMGVINMAHGEFMMIGAFTTYVVSGLFKTYLPPALYDYYLLAAIPAAFLVAGAFGLIVELLVIRHLYGRPLETLLATWGIGLILIQLVRVFFGDNLSVAPPKWMEGGVEVATDLILPLNRLFIIGFCLACIATVYLIVNRTKLGLLLRATTQNREMAAALGVPTRRIDAITFAFGTGLAGLAGVVVPLYNKINPSIGQEYIVDSFLVVVVGGVGKLAGAIWAGLGLGFIGKYLEPLISWFPKMESGASVIGKVMVLALVVVFLQWKPSGLFPPKGRVADA